ncbi:MAG: hypothetical protein K1X68_06130 [Saprospiraceae bacterium]|nr:hypothetical protein [Saprospiraceae bacterium]MBX7176330.1 hypothetical protein [Saprospiraceae bacterium]HMW39213.1 hypothetical protein [Saprospiraceae bacterium]HMX88967.1 hypothetical protein [Saprospiraceae bacterium]HMZ40864.1 hypothetical protein [Saprospiraceae bacterium]
MKSKKTKKFKDDLPVEGKIENKPIKKKEFDKTLIALLKTPPPQKNKKA